MFVIIIVVVAVVAFVIYCYNVGDQMEEFNNREPEWNPPRPETPPLPREFPPVKKCRCSDCKYLYSGTKTEYWYDENARQGKSETTRYRNWCLRTKMFVEDDLRYSVSEVKNCHYFDKK